MTSTPQSTLKTPTTAGGVLYVGPSLGRSLFGVAVALATGRGNEGLAPEAPLND